MLLRLRAAKNLQYPVVYGVYCLEISLLSEFNQLTSLSNLASSAEQIKRKEDAKFPGALFKCSDLRPWRAPAC